MVFTGVAAQAAHHISVAFSPTALDDTALQADSHRPTFLNAEAATLPFLVTSYATLDVATDGDATAGSKVVRITKEFHGRGCEFCLKVEYNPYLVGKAGFALTTGQPLDVPEPQRMILWARGEYGGEQVRFMVLGKQTSTTSSTLDEDLFDNVEFVSKSETVTLTSNWRMYHVDVPAANPEKFNDITHLVAVELDEGNGVRPVVIYIEGMVYDANPPDQTFIVEEAAEFVASS